MLLTSNIPRFSRSSSVEIKSKAAVSRVPSVRLVARSTPSKRSKSSLVST